MPHLQGNETYLDVNVTHKLTVVYIAYFSFCDFHCVYKLILLLQLNVTRVKHF